MKVVILAGGSGTRLWPISRSSFPKQFLHFGEKYSLLQKTILRFSSTYAKRDFLIVTNQSYYHLVKSQCSELDPHFDFHILVEPESKNTAPAVAIAIKYMEENMSFSPEESILVSSSDHIISPEEQFLQTLPLAEEEASRGSIVIFGVRPTKPETGYGYIKVENDKASATQKVEQFIEKPIYAKAQEYVVSGNYLWNSGLFMFCASTFWKELESHCPALYALTRERFKGFIAHFSECPSISIDYAILEKTALCRVISLAISWSDVGSWDSVYDTLEKDDNQNVKIGNVHEIDSKNCLFLSDKRLISAIGVEDLIVIETDDAVFLGKKGESQKVKQLVEELKQQKRKESVEHVTSHRPWGKYTILEEGDRYKIKRITVNPQQRLSLQMHYHRSEHWVIVRGTAKVTRGEEEKILHENESIFFPKSTVHRLENPGKVTLELIEVQVGEYVGEDDIVRMQDDYART